MAYWVLKGILTPILFGLWRVQVEGRAHVPRKGGAILAANHQSFCDSLFLPLVLLRKVTFLAKAEYFDSWKTAWFFQAVGQIPLRRGGGDVSQRALETAKEALAEGHLLALYPEGTRSRDQSVHRGRTGVARLALEVGVPVIPVGIAGTRAVQPIGSRFMRPFYPVTVRFGPPMRVPTTGVARGDVLRSFTDDLMHEIVRLSGYPYSDRYVESVVPARAAVPAGASLPPPQSS